MSAYYTPSAEEGAVFTYLFQQATNGAPTQRLGGADAVQFFVKSGLPIATLKTVWTLGSNGQKEMTQREFSTAMRLIALAQNGHGISDATLDSTIGVKVPPPKFSGVDLPQQPPSPAAAPASSPSYQVSPEARAQYEKYYAGLEKNSVGLVEGREAALFFAKSQLDRDVLRNLWKLSDYTNDGMLDLTEFIIGMHLIMLCKKGHALPSALPNELLQSASGGNAVPSAPLAPPPAIGLNASAFVNTSTSNFSYLDEPSYVAPAPLPTAAAIPPASPAYSSFSTSASKPAPLPETTQLFTRVQSETQLLSAERERLIAALKESTTKFQTGCDTLRALDEQVLQLRQQVLALGEELDAKRDAIGQQQDLIRARLEEAKNLTQQLAASSKRSNAANAAAASAFSSFE